MKMDLKTVKEVTLRFYKAYYAEHGKPPSVKLAWREVEGLTKRNFYVIFKGGQAEACTLSGIPVPEDRIKTTLKAREEREKAQKPPEKLQEEIQADEAEAALDLERKKKEAKERKRRADAERLARARAAARWMIDTIKGRKKPTMAILKPGVISPSVFQGTGTNPSKTIMDRCREWEAKEEDVYVSVAFGFAYADVPDGGAAVIAVTNDNQRLADEIAQDVSDLVWELREPLASRKIPKVKEGVAKALEFVKQGKVPVVLADHSDRLGDSTHVLRELLEKGAENFGVSTIADPYAVEKLMKEHEVGDTVTINVGAYTCNKYAGEPVEVTGTIEFLGKGDYRLTGPKDTGRLSRLGPTAALDLGDNNHLVISSTLHQVQDSEGFSHFGIDFDSLDIVVLKSRVHFRAFYESAAAEIIEVDAPGLGPADLSQFTYVNEPEGLYPISKK